MQYIKILKRKILITSTDNFRIYLNYIYVYKQPFFCKQGLKYHVVLIFKLMFINILALAITSRVSLNDSHKVRDLSWSMY